MLPAGRKNAARCGPQGLIDRKLLLQGAGFQIRFSEAALDQVILQTPEFQVDGKFSAERLTR
jgi:peptidyl-prolyl cis-trans isomerase D